MTGITLTGGFLVALALCDRRARPLVGVVCLVWFMTVASDIASPDRYAAVASRIPSDLVGALLSVFAIAAYRRFEIWAVSVVFFFMLMLSAHFVFWTSYSQGVFIWTIYANVLNALFLLQLAFLAGPGGTRLANILSRWAGASGSWRLADFVSRRVHCGKKEAP